MTDEGPRRLDRLAYMDLSDEAPQQRLLRKSLEVFRHDGGNPVLREMAQEVIAGRVTLREAVRIPAYADAVADQAQVFRRRWERMPSDERRALVGEGVKQAADERSAARAERVDAARR
ncbi:hypothetical protein [Streptomyces beihaiensis]|uniref:Uncharacterized protein n=1 Tax=Streptomyces beihaiensis TaxID=2984495 RepID=A0ABT3TXK7_9ACTN|nr:hypothetical protein [Streptomyces beihaiensis]MCX3061778.1 hypothetical protein [Streptomyces beihaiensis]